MMDHFFIKKKYHKLTVTLQVGTFTTNLFFDWSDDTKYYTIHWRMRTGIFSPIIQIPVQVVPLFSWLFLFDPFVESPICT